MAKKTTKTSADAAQDTNPEDWTEIKPTAATTETVEAAPAPKRKRQAEAAAEPQAEAAEPAPKKRGRNAAAPAAEVEPALAVEPQSHGAAKKAKRTRGRATMEDVFAGYVKDLEEQGKSDGTIASYRMELQLAAEDLGLETKIADLTPGRVLSFFTSDRVMKKRNGKPKSPLSIDKTRRVLRQALVWAQGAKLVGQAPVPELAASH